MYKFEVGKTYSADDTGMELITVLRRTPKMIKVTSEDAGVIWRMRIRFDENGNEYAIDSSAPKKWKDDFTYRAEREVV